MIPQRIRNVYSTSSQIICRKFVDCAQSIRCSAAKGAAAQAPTKRPELFSQKALQLWSFALTLTVLMKRIKQEQHIEIQEKSQQLKFRMQTEIQIDKHHALCQASGQLEELDYTKLYFAYSGIRKSQIEPRVLFKVLVCFQYFDRLTLVFHIFVPREQEKGLLHWLLSPTKSP